MRAHETPLTATEDEPLLDIASLIDVSFLLLVFFLVTSTLQRIETDLPMAGAGIPPGTALDEPLRFGIAIDAAGVISCNGESIESDAASREVPALDQKLRETRELARLTGSQVLVEIDADDRAHHQRLVDVMNALAANKLNHIAFVD